MIDSAACRRCGAELVHSYSTELVAAHQQLQQIAPDGSGFATVLAATSACSWNCLAVLAAQLAGPDADAAVLVVAERERQVTAEGYTPEGDDQQQHGELATAGIMYAMNVVTGGCRPYYRTIMTMDNATEVPPDADLTPPTGPPQGTVMAAGWPWGPDHWKPKDPERDLVRAAALVAAEADRLVRARRAAARGRF